jgi:hypothetical protein
MFNYSSTTLLLPGHFARISFAMSRKGISNRTRRVESQLGHRDESMEDGVGIQITRSSLKRY